MPYDYSLTIGDSNPVHVVVGYAMYIVVDMELIEGPRDYVTLSVTGLPSGVTATFPDLVDGLVCCTPTTAWEPIPTALKLAASGSATPGIYTITVTGVSGGLTRQADYDITVDAVPGDLPYTPIGTAPAIPSLATWESNMTTYGTSYCSPATFDDTYYDQQRVYFQVADYTGNSSWNTCAQNAEAKYRDDYLVPAGGVLPGYWNFAKGLRMDYDRTSDADSADAVVLLAENCLFANPTSPIVYSIPAGLSREVCYSIMAYLDYEKLGNPRSVRLVPYLDVLMGHFDQWFVSFSYRSPSTAISPPEAVGKYYLNPFMVGLACEALIRYYEEISQDPRIPAMVQTAADWLFTHAWNSGDGGFWYENWIADPANIPAGYWTDEGGNGGAPDLNMLIAPMYAWLYRKTGDSDYQVNGDAVFEGGVTGAFLGNPKQWNQNYRWSFDYVAWRTVVPQKRIGRVKRRRNP